MSLEESIDQLLPQTQCGECGYDGCRPYAEAISSGQAEINQCPPGGEATIEQMAKLLGREAISLNPAHGIHRPFRLAVIDEDECIGCTKCIQACPVDAILGAAKLMHTVINQYCTGCELCIPPCPVDCIEMLRNEDHEDQTRQRADQSRARYLTRNERLERELKAKSARKKKSSETPDKKDLQSEVFAAIKRSKAKRKNRVQDSDQ